VLNDAEFDAWYRLLETPGLGRASVRRLLSACGSPAAVLTAGPGVWRQVAGAEAAQALLAAESGLPDRQRRLDAAQAWRAQAGHHVLTLGDEAWPAALLQIADPPLLLYAQGQLEALKRPALAIVGSRQATAQGRDNARAFAAALSAQGYCVVSGLAQGIDAAAHEGALCAAAGTIAVVGTGLDRVYPPRHADLAARIAAQGALLSEYAPGTPALPEHFPQRNRLIAGLSLGTLVVEAALRSGSLITARLASEYGREVFAVPGSIHSPQSKGCHALIQQGAKLVESADDILDELLGPLGPLGPLRPPAPRPQALPSTADDGGAAETGEDPLLEALGTEAVTLDALLARTGSDTPALMARLMELELEGRVSRLPGGLYQRRFRA
jgi:DNA processing protein